MIYNIVGGSIGGLYSGASSASTTTYKEAPKNPTLKYLFIGALLEYSWVASIPAPLCT